MRFSPAAPIAVQPLGPVSASEILRLRRLLADHFEVESLVLDPMPPPASTFDVGRRQFDADLLLEELFDRLPERCLRVIGVTEQDLFVSGRTFVFGYAHLTDGMALYSVKRLRTSYYGRGADPAVEGERVRRAVVHELGHTFGAPHCEDEECAMHTVSQVDTLDALSPEYCRGCRERVRAGLAIAPWAAKGRWERGMALFRRRQLARALAELRHAVGCAPFEARYRHAFELVARALGELAEQPIAAP